MILAWASPFKGLLHIIIKVYIYSFKVFFLFLSHIVVT